MRVVRASSWLIGVVVVVVVVLAAGFIARRYRLSPVAVSLVEVFVWVVFMMLVFLRDTGLLWVIPMPETVRVLPGLLSTAAEQIAVGTAPLDAGLSLSMLIVGGTGLLTIITDYVVLTTRMPLLAAIGLIAVWLIPPIAVPDEVDIMAFVLLAAAILFLMRSDTVRGASRPAAEHANGRCSSDLYRHCCHRGGRDPGRSTDAHSASRARRLGHVRWRCRHRCDAAAGSGSATPGPGRAHARPNQRPRRALPARQHGLPIRRGRVESRPRPHGEPGRIGGIRWHRGGRRDRLTEYVTTVEVLHLASPWPPVPYPAVAVDGLQGRWSAAPYNRTVHGEAGTTQGQSYEVVTIGAAAHARADP